DEPRRAPLYQAHGVEGGLQRPGGVVNEPLLVPAHHLCAFFDPQSPGEGVGGLLDLHPGRGAVWYPAGGRHLGGIDTTFALTAADSRLWIDSQRGDERFYLLDDEGSLAWAGLDQAQGGEHLDRVTDGVTRRVVLVPELTLGRKLAALSKFAGLDLVAQI